MAERGKSARAAERRSEAYQAALALVVDDLGILFSERAYGRVAVLIRDGEIYQIETTRRRQPGVKVPPQILETE